MTDLPLYDEEKKVWRCILSICPPHACFNEHGLAVSPTGSMPNTRTYLSLLRFILRPVLTIVGNRNWCSNRTNAIARHRYGRPIACGRESGSHLSLVPTLTPAIETHVRTNIIAQSSHTRSSVACIRLVICSGIHTSIHNAFLNVFSPPSKVPSALDHSSVCNIVEGNTIVTGVGTNIIA
jgi:hypothetical protein